MSHYTDTVEDIRKAYRSLSMAEYDILEPYFDVLESPTFVKFLTKYLNIEAERRLMEYVDELYANHCGDDCGNPD